MHVNRCSSRETPGGAGMIEMNVTQKNVAHVFGVRLERGRGHDTGATELARVEDMNLHA